MQFCKTNRHGAAVAEHELTVLREVVSLIAASPRAVYSMAFLPDASKVTRDGAILQMPLYRNFDAHYSIDDVARMTFSVLCVLETMHANGFVHCDVSYNNVLLDVVEHRGMLIDYDLCRRILPVGSTLQVRGSLGTKGYVAPEVRGESGFVALVCDKSDIYSLGRVVAKRLLKLADVDVEFHDPEVWLAREIDQSIKEELHGMIHLLRRRGMIAAQEQLSKLVEVVELMLAEWWQERPSAADLLQHPCFAGMEQEYFSRHDVATAVQLESVGDEVCFAYAC